MVPADYRDVLSQPLKGVAATAAKLCGVRTTLQKWEQHRAAGTYPPHLQQRVPTVPMTAGFREAGKGAELTDALAASHKTWLTTSLDALLRGKRDEVAFLEASLEASHLHNSLCDTLNVRHAYLREHQKVAKFVTVDVSPNKQELRLDGFQISPLTDQVHQHLVEDVLVLAYRVITIVNAQQTVAAGKRDKKKAIVKAATEDVEMADATGSSSSATIQSLVDKAVSAALKKSQQKPRQSGKKDKKGKGKALVCYNTIPVVYTHTHSSSVGEEDEAQGCGQSLFFPRSGSSSKLSATSSRQIRQNPLQRVKGWEEEEVVEEVERLEEGASEGEGKEQGDLTCSQIYNCKHCWSRFKYGDINSLPDSLLSLSFPRAVSLVRLYIPIDVLIASQYKHIVHTSPGVNLPDWVSFNLSVGHKYMIYSPLSTKLITDAYADFKRRLRWRIKFAFEKTDSSYYDPEYEVANPLAKNKAPPLLPFYLEAGFREGERLLRNAIAHIPSGSGTADQNLKRLNPSLKDVEEFLIKHDYVVTNTDKNLGLAVSERTWIDEMSMKIIKSKIPNNYGSKTCCDYSSRGDSRESLVQRECCQLFAE
jgi:hypothetical protein